MNNEEAERENKRRFNRLVVVIATTVAVTTIALMISLAVSQAMKRESAEREYLHKCQLAKMKMQECVQEQLSKGNHDILFCEKEAQLKFDCMQWPTTLKRQHLPW